LRLLWSANKHVAAHPSKGHVHLRGAGGTAGKATPAAGLGCAESGPQEVPGRAGFYVKPAILAGSLENEDAEKAGEAWPNVAQPPSAVKNALHSRGRLCHMICSETTS
jgi:hypothetical protein